MHYANPSSPFLDLLKLKNFHSTQASYTHQISQLNANYKCDLFFKEESCLTFLDF